MARNKQGKAPGTPGKVQYAPRRQHTLNIHDPKFKELTDKLPSGLLAILANESARYSVFTGNVMATVMPPGSRFSMHTGCYVVDSSNRAYGAMAPTDNWVMLMGDDHQWPPEMVVRLLAQMYHHDLDIIAPLCFKRSFPPQPVVYEWQSHDDNYMYPIDLNKYPNGGLIEVDGVGSAGMIVQRRVIEAMEPPWFVLGDEHWGEDLNFCRRAKELGFKVWVDLDMSLGHIINTTIWPVRNEAGVWACEYDFGGQGGFVLGI